MPRYINNINIISSNGRYEEEMLRLYNEQMRNLDIQKSLENVQTFMIGERNAKHADYSYSNILKDYGKGRISDGLKSLELLSTLCSGVNHNDMFLFDRKTYYGTVYDIKNGTQQDLQKIILLNLGMYECITNLPIHVTKDYTKLIDEIGSHVKDGTFDINKYRTYILKESKRLMKIYLENNK